MLTMIDWLNAVPVQALGLHLWDAEVPASKFLTSPAKD